MSNLHPLIEQQLALAGVVQAALLVQQVSRTGTCDEAAFEASISSICVTDPDTPQQVFGQLSNLKIGLGLDASDAKILKSCEEDMAKITGQKPVTTKFKKSVANFKTRKGSNAGLKVTLRKNKMYEFLDRLVNIALPRIKDFRGLSPKGFDKFGNYTFGIKEHIIFPEVSFDRADKVALFSPLFLWNKSTNYTRF